MADLDALLADLLRWIGPDPRPYAEVLDAWRTSCPGLPVWEEALARELVVRRTPAAGAPTVAVTAAGRAFLGRRG